MNRIFACATGLVFRPAGKAAVVLATFVLFLTVTAILVFPTRPKPMLLTMIAWSVFFALLHRHGYGALALQAVVSFWLLILADLLNFDSLPVAQIVAYMGLVMATFGAAIALDQWLPRRSKAFPVAFATAISIVLSALGAVYIWHNVVFGMSVKPEIYYAIFQMNAGHSSELVREFSDGRVVLAGCFGLISIGLLGYAQCRSAGTTVPLGLLIILLVVPTGMLASSRAGVRIISNLVESTATYKDELAEFRRLRDVRAGGQLEIQASKVGCSETYVIVVGESLDRNHMHLYGYHRNTTPRLDSLYRADDLLKFENAYSTHTTTIPALSLALTAANRRNGRAFSEAASILDVASAAGMETHWITNQVRYGPFDHLVSIVARRADPLIPLKRDRGETAATEGHADKTIPVLEAILNERTERNRLIVVHLIGSPAMYCSRFPDKFAPFEGLLAAGEFGMAHGDGRLARYVNCHDNGVLYNDNVIANLHEAVRRRGGITGFLYFADHGEDVLELSGSHSDRFTFAMVEIPMLLWLSEDYRRKYPARYTALRARTDALFGADFLFDTVLGIAGVETPEHDDLADLSSPLWGTGRLELSLLDGKRHFLEEENFRYHQRTNLAKLGTRQLLSRILPHQVNSTGEYAQVRYDGGRGVESDLVFRSVAGQGYFEVGHHDADASGIRLAEFLEQMPQGEIKKLWFDMKNLNARNLDAILSRLVRLDQRFGLRQKVIFESPAPELLPSIGREGFHTSYYLPTERLIELYEAGDGEGLRREAERIVRKVASGGLSAVSFDSRLYAFVKEHLEPALPATVAYHTWDISLRLADPSFLQRLEATDWFADPRVETILVTYRSEFGL